MSRRPRRHRWRLKQPKPPKPGDQLSLYGFFTARTRSASPPTPKRHTFAEKVLRQSTLDEYFPSINTCKPVSKYPSFLDLPFPVRRRIYLLGGLVRTCPVNLSAQRPRNRYNSDLLDDSLLNSHDYDCCYQFKLLEGTTHEHHRCGYNGCLDQRPPSFIFACHTVYAETSSIFWSENKFQVSLSRVNRLQSLRNLNPRNMALLTSLSIRLNKCSCVLGHRCLKVEQIECRVCNHSCFRGRDKPLDRVSDHPKSILSEWRAVANRLAKHIQPSRLRFTLICDTTKNEVAREIVKPLLDFPLLSECSIRLGQDPRNGGLQRIAEMTVFHVTGKSMERFHSGFPFLRLPREIQLQILHHTDLVAPQNLEWESRRHLALAGSSGCCRLCTETLETCCCAVHHAAAFSKLCTCWKMPSAIFRVNHQMHKDATEIFFRNNTFVVPPRTCKFWTHDGDYGWVSGQGYMQVDDTGWYPASFLQFLNLFPDSTRHLLRSIQLVMPRRFRYGYLAQGSNGHADWLATIDLIATAFPVSNLTLTVDFPVNFGLRPEWQLKEGETVEQKDRRMWREYKRILEPLGRLEGLQNLFVYTGWPVGKENWHRRAKQEQFLEKRVMGEAYDSYARGKPVVPSSQELEKFIRT